MVMARWGEVDGEGVCLRGQLKSIEMSGCRGMGRLEREL